MKPFLSPHEAAGSLPPENPPKTPVAPETPPAPAAPEPPPATRIVCEGTKTEREIELEQRLADAEARRMKAERDAAYSSDEACRFRDLQSVVPRRKPQTKTGVGFFTYEEED